MIENVMGDVGRISAEVTTNIAEISRGIVSIGSSVIRVSEMAAVVGDGSTQLDQQLQRFKLE